MNMIWGGRQPETLPLRSLDPDACAIEEYLREFAGARFHVTDRPLYPAFVGIMRRALRVIAATTHEHGRRLTTAEVDSIFDDCWPTADFADHPHRDVYRKAGRRMAAEFVAAYPDANAELLDSEIVLIDRQNAPKVKGDFVGLTRTAGGQLQPILFRVEVPKLNKAGTINWSGLSTLKRAGFVLLESQSPGSQPRVFSGSAGKLINFLWSKDSVSLSNDVETITEQYDRLVANIFNTKVDPYSCDDCSMRLVCPYWLKAVVPTSVSNAPPPS
jgi:hypothetical protein